MNFAQQIFASGDVVYTLGQVLGIIIALLGFFVYLSNNRCRILAIKLIIDALAVAQQAMIGAMTGALLSGIAVFRGIVFYNRFKYKWANCRIWLYVFLILMGVAPFFTWNGPISFLPAVGSILAVIGFYVADPNRIRLLGLLSIVPWLAYSILTRNIGAVFQNIISLASIMTAFLKDWFDMRKTKSENE